MKDKLFQGSGVAIVTPFKEDGVDYEKLGQLIEFQIRENTDAIIICGTTGEASTMPDKEHLEVIKYTVDKVDKRIPVIAGTGSNDTAHAIRLSQAAEDIGADALLSVTPYYNKTTQEGLYLHYEAIAKSVSLPIVLYNVPSRTNLNIEPATYERLCKFPNINAVKECNLLQMPETVKRCGKDLYHYSGEDSNIYYLLAGGGLGVISVMANVIPQYTHDLVQAYFDGNLDKSWQMQLNAIDLIKLLFSEVNPIPIKEAVNYLGFDIGHCRLPLSKLRPENKEKLFKELERFV